MTDAPPVLRLGECRDLQQVGGKASNLARLIAAGFSVPDGFVVTTAAYRLAAAGDGMPAELAAQIARAYERMGSPVVAVRSSATAEDLAGASMAGQYETFLDVRGEADVLAAVEKCWASVRSDRIRTYLAERGIDPAQVAMAVVVQRLVAAEVAGVLFTANPRTGLPDEMLVEAGWGLGEAVVSGMVQPDSLVLDRATGRVKTATISTKTTWVPPGGHGPQPLGAEKRDAPCLTSRDVHELWHLGLRVAEHFGSAQDIEWAIAGGRLYLLQSRAVTTLEEAEAYQQCLQHTRAQLRQWKREGRGDWVRHNIAETLPHPTPLTWSVVRRFMSGDGGFGAMYKTVGFEPAETVRRDGFLDLIAGRIYMDLSRGPGMFFDRFPYRYDLDLLRDNPDAAQGPPTVPAGSVREQYRIGRRLAAINGRIEEWARDYDRTFDGELVPALVKYVRQEKARDLTQLDTEAWLTLWHERQRRLLDEFGPQSLLPSLIAAMALERLRAFLDEHFWNEDPQALANQLTAAAEPDLTLQANQALYDMAHGRQTVAQWLELYGHRGPDEFDLAAPRWRDRPEALEAMAAHLAKGASPLAMHERRAAESQQRLKGLSARLSWSDRRELRRHVALARRYLRFREDGKHYLMLGYGLLRDMALEAGRRLDVDDEVFLLTSEELQDALETGFAPLHLMAECGKRRAAESKLVLGHVIAEADIDELGKPPRIDGGACLRAFPISAGLRSGPVRIVRTPHEAGDLGRDYVLACPSTDPSWTPLFVNAAGLVLECGGTLSHGAVVAREIGIPAVVLAGATDILRDGEIIRVDGHLGQIVREERATPEDVGRLSKSAPEMDRLRTGPATVSSPGDDPTDTRIPRDLTPPVAGRRERRSAVVRNVFLLIWSVFLAVAFLLPGTWLYDRAMELMDGAFWPVVVAWGKPAAVAVVAGGLAVLTMLVQRLLTDNRRLRVAKRRAARLRALAARLPQDSPRRKAMEALAKPVQPRVVMASMVPLAVLLGPIVVPFLWWFPARVDPAAWNPEPGVMAFVTAAVDGEFTAPVSIDCDADLTLDERTPASQSLPPIRNILEDRLGEWQRESDMTKLPWQVQEAGQLVGKALLDDLTQYLQQDLPPQTLTWNVVTPKDTAGRFRVAVTPAGGEPVEVHLTIGDASPPEPTEDLGDGKLVQVVRAADAHSPVKYVKVTYEQRPQPAFWAPFSGLGWSWDAGWLLLYIVVYLPVMLVSRWVLRLP